MQDSSEKESNRSVIRVRQTHGEQAASSKRSSPAHSDKRRHDSLDEVEEDLLKRKEQIFDSPAYHNIRKANSCDE